MKEKERLREDLRRLDELARSSALDPAARARLAEIARDIEALLDEGEAGETRESLVERLRSAAEHFEESHPSLTAAVGRIADALAALGI
jgi:hypothetical protein